MTYAPAKPVGVVVPSQGPSIVTPEAVVLELTPAALGWRILAYLLDWVVLSILLAVVIGVPAWLLSVWVAEPEGWVLAIVGIAMILPLVYFAATETLMRGRTIGKLITRLRVVTREGGQIQFRHALIRSLLGMVDFGLSTSVLLTAPGLVAIICIGSTASRQRLGDMAAGTLVVRERGGPPPAPVNFAPPAGLEPYVQLLDTSMVSDAEYHVLRAHLMRGAYPPERTVELAAWLCNRVQPLPPQGTPPHVYLLAVAAARQARARLGAGVTADARGGPWLAPGPP